MITNKFNIEEYDMAKNESKDFILNFLDKQIMNCRMQHLAEWEKDHSLSFEPTKEKLAALKAKKQEIELFFNECPAPAEAVDVNVSFEVNVKEQALEAAYA